VETKQVEQEATGVARRPTSCSASSFKQFLNEQMQDPEFAQAYDEAGSNMDKFHAHLDRCHRCANEPFNLCPVGAALLTA
jgi:hypothetical protein